MCLSVPAKLIEINPLPKEAEGSGAQAGLKRTGRVSLGGVIKEISLAYVPDAKIGDYVLVHVGFALSIIDESEAQFVFDYLKHNGGAEEV